MAEHDWQRWVDKRDSLATWIAREILPHEGAVRGWVARRWRGLVDPDDVIQEAYCRLSSVTSFHHIYNPVGYFRRTVHSAATDMLRRNRVINFVSMTETDWLNVKDHEPLADRVVVAEQELRRVDRLLARLSDTCRRAIVLRRIEEVSQREAAQCLGVSEDVVRNHLVRGVKVVLKALAEQDIVVESGQEEERKVELVARPRFH